MLKAHRLAALAAVVLVGSVTPAKAVLVTYSTSGVFGSSGTATLNQGGAQIRFNGTTATVDPPPATNALFGSFETLASPAANTTLVDTFTLTITQTTPAPGGNVVFTSTVGGTIRANNSQAFVQFAAPLTRIIAAGLFQTSYRIVEGDDANPGRLELFPNVGQVSTLNGEINVVPIPEPGTMALACAALPLLGLGYVRRRRQMAKV